MKQKCSKAPAKANNVALYDTFSKVMDQKINKRKPSFCAFESFFIYCTNLALVAERQHKHKSLPKKAFLFTCT
jgi:hypothetical protein